MNTYTLVAYMPSSSTSNCGSGCCGRSYFDSDFMMERGLSLEKLAEEIAKLRVASDDHECSRWNIYYFDDKL